jgi:hypothetical protein
VPDIALWILGEGRPFITACLEQVPDDLKIWDDEAERLLLPGGPLRVLWDALGTTYWPQRAQRGGLGGRTKRSKLLAAKRPRLAPVLDKIVRESRRLPKHVPDYWSAFRNALRDDELRSRIKDVTSHAPAEVSVLRRIDVVIWMTHRSDR